MAGKFSKIAMVFLFPNTIVGDKLALGITAWLSRQTRTTSSRPNLIRTVDTANAPSKELLSVEALEELGRSLAKEQLVVRRGSNPGRLQAKLKVYEHSLLDAYRLLTADVSQQKAISPAAEWLLDNFPIVLDQLREIREDLPGGYYRQLPQLTKGPLVGFPRVYVIARELINHTDGRLDIEHLIRFVTAYQNVSPLFMGELWAIAIMLRIGLVENLGMVAQTLLEERQLELEADQWADRLIKNSKQAIFNDRGSDEGSVTTTMDKLVHTYPQLPASFATHLLRRLLDNSADEVSNVDKGIQSLASYFNIQFGSTEALMRFQKQRLAVNQATAANAITSMRTLSALNWADWFEQVSLIEQILRKDPSKSYAESTFATRNHYRHEVERMTRATGLAEIDVAWHLVNHAQTQAVSSDSDRNGGTRRSHIGYYLVGDGRPEFETRLNYHQSSPGQRLRSLLARYHEPIYLAAIASGTIGLSVLACSLADKKSRFRERKLTYLAAGLLLTLIPASEVAQGLVNWGITKILPPRLLPRLDLKNGVPAALRTMVVVPTLLLTKESVVGQFDRLEVVHLANADPHLHFALLTDFTDAQEAKMPEDKELLDLALARTAELNVRYGPDRFFLFHRRRVWNQSQSCFMGWERKRGKLAEFNRLLAGATDTTFEVQLGQLDLLPKIRYVITLDADTQLPRDAAKVLIGTLAHPLNQAVVDERTHQVVEGYGILQPRIGIDLGSANRSLFARLFSGNVGLDPYTTAVSNVYMDLFGVGIFAGKGIYDPLVLRQVLAGRFPENTLLSHDLIEGAYARTGLLSDVELLDNYPSTYASYAARTHRWVRGDWQILRWFLPRVPQEAGGTVPNVLLIMARYKIFDNLRRSLVPPAMIFLLGAGWSGWVCGSAVRWTAVALAPLALPLVFDLLDFILNLASPRTAFTTTIVISSQNLLPDLARFGVNLTFLATQASSNLNAIGLTLSRLFITHCNLLEWQTAEQVQHRADNSFAYLFRRLPLTLLPGGLLTLLGNLAGKKPHPGSWRSALPVLLDWLVAPVLASWLDRPRVIAKTSEQLNEVERLELRKLARTYWNYFVTFVTPEGRYLAPDNFQEDPRPVIAYRTSPTNIGLQLLADLSARDFGYIGLLDLTARTEHVFTSIEQLEHFRGHLLNWYDTKTLQPLPPNYVSLVDSGNLAGHLLTLRQGYLALLNQPIIGPEIYAGLLDTLTLLQEALTAEDGPATEVKALALFLAAKVPSTLTDYKLVLQAVVQQTASLKFNTMEAKRWVGTLNEQAVSLLNDMDNLLPWLTETLPDPASPALKALFSASATLVELVRLLEEVATQAAVNGKDELEPGLVELLKKGQANLTELYARQIKLTEVAIQQVRGMDFRFLYDSNRHLFSIGYFVTEGRRDNSYYDLLASEARLGSFVAIAKQDVPQEHWFHLGRSLTQVSSGATLLSWSGTMFEYLMPRLVMRDFPHTLLAQTYKAVVGRQRQYGRQRKIPWGISESAYNVRDLNLNYQYRAFGVPGLGLKRGLGSDLTVAPYATVLALPVQPRYALDNIRVLQTEGMQGAYGLYEAIDYTPERLPPGLKKVIIRSFMVHHQAMSFLTLNNYLHQNIMQTRFHAEPMVQATEMLLQERFSREAPRQQLPETDLESRIIFVPQPLAEATRHYTTPHTAVPQTQLLSNGHYTVVITNAGAGFSRYDDLAVTRWHEDATRDNWGNFCYIRDVRTGETWSPAYQPACHVSQAYQVIFSLHKAEFQQHIVGIETRMEVTVSPEDNAEIRHLSLTNLTEGTRELELTSYSEVVLALAAADSAQPVFSNLFVETEFWPDQQALVASRRPRTNNQTRVWGLQVIAVQGHTVGTIEYETDRAAFLGREGTTSNPAALSKPLSGTTGAVLDPIFSLRRRVRIVPSGTVHITFTTAVAHSREEALQLAAKYRDPGMIARAFELAGTEGMVEMRQLGVNADDIHRFQQLGAYAIYNDSRLRAAPERVKQNTQGQSALWKYGISGDYPIMLVQVENNEELPLVRELLVAHEYWHTHALKVDIVILSQEVGGYNQPLAEQVLGLIQGSRASEWLEKPGGGSIFVLRTANVTEADLILLQTVARAVLVGNRGDLAQQLYAARRPVYLLPALTASKSVLLANPTRPLLPAFDELPKLAYELQFASDYGGFTPDGQEYIINLLPGAPTPAPWSNVLANESFGCIVTERGSGYTWAINSQQNRLSPWSNDPVCDPAGEAIYLRDVQSNLSWSPLTQLTGSTPFRVRHGFGYSSFAHTEQEIQSDLTIFVPPADPIKIYHLHLHNHSTTSRYLSATFYVEWVLGVQREQMAPYVITSFDPQTGAVLARNPYNTDFSERIAFVATTSRDVNFTCDRREFVGRNGNLKQPVGLGIPDLSESVGAGFDPCTALRYSFELAGGEDCEIVFLLGQGVNLVQAQNLVSTYREPLQATLALAATRRSWQTILQKVQIHTPEPLLDVLLNGWLLYQTLSCRIWGRSAFYQSGGAFGFRDQLQDVMALVIAAPELTRAQLVRAAQHQFIEGDVQHWWHSPSGRGIRTNFSDDYLWLPFVTNFYLKTTEDRSVLEENIPFLEGRFLKEGEAEYFDLPTVSDQQASLYEHCVRAIDHSLTRFGSHGLPLMGSGDWNDGMNLVGDEGKGESVWVGWFLYLNLTQMAALAESRGEIDRAKHYREVAKCLQSALEEHAWDGEWYLRAFFDDGTPLGSKQNEECRIDSLTQSWAVISEAVGPARGQQVMAAVEAQLIDRQARLVKLFTPPFDKTTHNPGYIKGYVPGVRENGGQYTHAAIWVLWAYAMLGKGEKLAELYQLINPIAHSVSNSNLYKVEPYVIAADVYAEPPHTGRGGWTWYTGSAGWLYRLGVEMLLGLRKEGDYLGFVPCIPPQWQQYEVTYTHIQTSYHIRVERAASTEAQATGLKNEISVELDGVLLADSRLHLKDDRVPHQVRVVLELK